MEEFYIKTPKPEVIEQLKQETINLHPIMDKVEEKFLKMFMEYLTTNYLIINCKSSDELYNERFFNNFYHIEMGEADNKGIRKISIKDNVLLNELKPLNICIEYCILFNSSYEPIADTIKDITKKAHIPKLSGTINNVERIEKSIKLDNEQIKEIKEAIKDYNNKVDGLNKDIKEDLNNNKSIIDGKPTYKINNYCYISKYIDFGGTEYNLRYNNYYHKYDNLGKLLSDLNRLNSEIAKDLTENNINYFFTTEFESIPSIDGYECIFTNSLDAPLYMGNYITQFTFYNEIGKFFINRFQIVEAKTTKELYYFNPDLNCYCALTDNILNSFFSMECPTRPTTLKKLKKSIKEYVSIFIPVSYNIIKFNNCLYDINSFKIVNPEDPVIPYLECPYNYKEDVNNLDNLNYKLGNDYLNSTYGEDKEAYLEVLGYMFTAGNNKEILIIKTGSGGGGKTTSSRIEEAIFPSTEKQYKQLISKFGKSDVLGKKLIIVPNVDKIYLEDLKGLMSGEGQYIEAKGQDQIAISGNTSIKYELVCNNIPNIPMDQTMKDKLLIFHYKNNFRYTEADLNNENKRYSDVIINNPEAMEFIISQAIEQYKEMLKNKKPFKILNKNINYLKSNSSDSVLINALNDILEVDTSINTNSPNDVIVSTKDLEKIIKNYSMMYNVNIETTPSGRIRKLNKYLSMFIGSNKKYKAINKNGLTNVKFYPEVKYKKNINGTDLNSKDYYLKS